MLYSIRMFNMTMLMNMHYASIKYQGSHKQQQKE
jgi:hypothetical protein